MNKTTVAQLSGLPVDAQVYVVEATVKSLSHYSKSKPTDAKKFSFQDAEITDGQASFTAVFKDRDEVPRTIVGKRITFLAFHGERGWSGLKIKERNNYKTKQPELVLWVTPSATVTDTANSQDPGSAESEQEPQRPAQTNVKPQPQANQPAPQRQATQNAPAASQTPPRSAPEQQPATQTQKPAAPVPGSPEDQVAAIRQVRAFYGKEANRYILAYRTALYVAKTLREENQFEMPVSEVCALGISLAIAAERGCKAIDGLPTGPMPHKDQSKTA